MTIRPRTKQGSFTNIRTGPIVHISSEHSHQSQVCRKSLYLKLQSLPSRPHESLCYKHIKSMLTHCNKLMQIVHPREGSHNKEPYITAHGGLSTAAAHTHNAALAKLTLFSVKHNNSYLIIIYTFGTSPHISFIFDSSRLSWRENHTSKGSLRAMANICLSSLDINCDNWTRYILRKCQWFQSKCLQWSLPGSERHKERVRQTDKQTKTDVEQTDSQRDKQTERQSDTHTKRETARQLKR